MEEMKPFLLGQVFSYTFKLLGKDFWKMFFTVVICMLIMLLPIAVFIVSIFINPGLIADFSQFSDYSFLRNPLSVIPSGIWIMYAGLIIVSLLIVPFIQGVILAFSSSRIQGKPLSFKEAFSFAAHKYGKLVLTMLSSVLLALPLTALYLVIYFGSFFSSIISISSGNLQNLTGFMQLMPLLSLLNLVFSAVMIIVGIAYSFAGSITVNEELFAFPAIFKGFKLLFKGNFWRNIGHYLLMALTIMGFSIGFSLVITLFSIPLAFAAVISPIFIVFIVVVILGFAGFVYPFQLTFTQLMYFNARLTVDGTMFNKLF